MTLWRSAKQPVKTAIAAALSFVAYRMLHLQHGYWAVISAVIVMQSNLGRSIDASVTRLVGTGIGAICGATIAWLLGRNVASLAIGIALAMWICAVSKLEDSFRLAGVTASIVMLIEERNVWQAGANRFIDVALGIFIALAVTVVWPARASSDLRRSLAVTFRELRSLFDSVICCATESKRDHSAIDDLKARAQSLARQNADLLADVDREPGPGNRLLAALQQSSERIRDHLFGMDYSARAMSPGSFHQYMSESFIELSHTISGSFEMLARDVADETRSATIPDLDTPVENLERSFEELRSSGAMRDYATDDVLRFYSLLFRLRQLVSELRRSAEFANALDHVQR